VSARRLLVGALLFVALVLLVGRWTASLYADYHWFKSLGAIDVWRVRMATSAALTAGSFLIAALFSFLNLFAVRQSVVSLVLPRRIANIEIGEEVPGRFLFSIVLGLSVAMGIALIFPADRWPEAMLARVGKPFGEADPYFNLDLGFFAYWLPFESAVHAWSVIVLAAVCVVVVLLYALTPSLKWARGNLYVSAYVRRHFTVLGAVVLLMLAWSYRLGMFRLTGGGSGLNGLFTAVDQQMLTVLLLLSVITMCAAFVVAWAGWSGQMRLAFSTVSVVLLLSLLAHTVAPLVIRRALEPIDTPRYIGTRLTYTRRAFGVDAERLHTDSVGASFANASDVISRVAVWDGATLSRATERLRHVRTFGNGPAWTSNGHEMTAHVVERGTETSPELRDVWGISRFDPSAADEKGQPLRVAAGGEDFVIAEPVVYDSAPGYSVMSDSTRQIAGVEMVSTRSRLMHAWSLQNFRLLLGDLPANRPVLVERRDVRERVEALVPFFVQGSEVVPLVANDTLYWVLELFSASSTYPLSQHFTIIGEERAYFQHAATALVHASSGRVTFIIGSSPDPVTQTWAANFRHLFKTIGELPPRISSALPPITDLARAQALAFGVTGFKDSTARRHFAVPDGADSAATREAIRVVLPSLGGVAAIWTMLDSTDHVSGVIAAPGGASRVTTWIPLANDNRRWGTVVDRLRVADTSLHEVGATRAPLRVVPVAKHALYIQPAFVSRPGGAPTLAHVALLASDTVHIGATLAAALGAVQPTRGGPTEAGGNVHLRADSLYRSMRDALARGDWAGFGRAFDALGAVIRGMPR
jgi:uncharacterized membrane protein (UPF0182 family)